MPFSHATLSPALLAMLLFLATVVAGFAIARAAKRRWRFDRRRRQHLLAQHFRAFLDTRIPAAQMRAAARGVDPAAFWTALEAATAGLPRPTWWRFACALEPSPHGATERRALHDESPWRRELAARRLGLLASLASRRALRQVLEDGPELLRWTAATALARARDAYALRWILGHSDAFATRTPRAWTSLLRGFGRGAAGQLAAALERGSRDSRLERALVEVLGLLRAPGAIPAIAARIRHPDLELRVSAARALGMLAATQCQDPLVDALDDQAWQVRAQAARALGRIHATGAVGALERCLTDRSWWVRHHSAYALSELGTDGTAALQRTIDTSPDPYARDIAEEALSGGWQASA